MSAKKEAPEIFLFAHPDDECGVLQVLSTKLEQLSEIHCIFYTSGTPNGVKSNIREKESSAVLSSIGLSSNNIHFFGSEHGIPDGRLVFRMEHASLLLLNFLSKFTDGFNLYIPAWEGGHPDHDALHAIGAVVAKKKEAISRTFQYPLYNAYLCRGPFFKVLSPLSENGPETREKIPFFKRLKFLKYCLSYPSQAKTWFGLFPFFLIHYIFNPIQSLQPISFSRLLFRPHGGELYYEKRKFSSWGIVGDKVKDLIQSMNA
jgi:hypothetical protein